MINAITIKCNNNEIHLIFLTKKIDYYNAIKYIKLYKMVKILSDKYENTKYDEYFKQFNCELSDFQKHSIEQLVENNNVLITAPTSSGKTLPASFLIKHYVKQGKKIIYTTPIKALSNQKYNSFQSEYPNISIGLLTGDKKIGVNSDVLIMTTEILKDMIQHKAFANINNGTNNSCTNDNLSLFNLNFDDIAYVVFDEVHYFNDAERGGIYETLFISLPKHIKLLFLSGTLGKPAQFSSWLEKIRKTEIYIASTEHRIVPLYHHLFITLPISTIKNIGDKVLQNEFQNNINKMFLIKNTSEAFSNKNFVEQYNKINKIKKYVSNNAIHISPKYVLNNLCDFMIKERFDNENNMFPAICFVLSKKKVEDYALDIEKNLFEDDSKNTYIIKEKSINILKKITGYEKYINCLEFETLIKLFEKGIAIHHSGMHPIFKELVEILYNDGFIKLLFATETFSVGINAPTKTVIFTGLTKFTSNGMRILHSSEYTQMSGRAGRRGIDIEGNIIHLNNLFAMPEKEEYDVLLNGEPQILTSKFKINHELILAICNSNTVNNNIVNTDIIGNNNTVNINNDLCETFIKNSLLQTDFNKCETFIKNSLLQTEIDIQINILQKEQDELKNKLSKYNFKDKVQLENYSKIVEELEKCTNLNQRKKIARKIEQIKHTISDKDIDDFYEQKQVLIELEKNKNDILNMDNFVLHNIELITYVLIKNNFLDNFKNIVNKGKIALNIKTVNSLVLTDLLIDTNYFEKLNEYEIIGLICCFIEIKIHDDYKKTKLDLSDENDNNGNFHKFINLTNLTEAVEKLTVINYKYSESSNELYFDMVKFVINWCFAQNENECQQVIQDIKNEFMNYVFLGDFYGLITKINNVVEELLKIDFLETQLDTKNKLSKISALLLKSIIGNESLYV